MYGYGFIDLQHYTHTQNKDKCMQGKKKKKQVGGGQGDSSKGSVQSWALHGHSNTAKKDPISDLQKQLQALLDVAPNRKADNNND